MDQSKNPIQRKETMVIQQRKKRSSNQCCNKRVCELKAKTKQFLKEIGKRLHELGLGKGNIKIW